METVMHHRHEFVLYSLEPNLVVLGRIIVGTGHDKYRFTADKHTTYSLMTHF